MSGRSEKSSLNKLTTRQSRDRLRGQLARVARWVLMSGLVVVSVYGILLLGTTSIESSAFQVQKIEYSGVRNLDTQALDEMIQRTFPDNVLKIRLEKLRSLVESENWVKSATVRRRLPNRIQVRVTEREPVAVAQLQNELVVVDEEGIVLAPFGPSFDFIDLPIVKGLQSTALENARSGNAAKMKVYLELVRQLDSDGRNYAETLSEIDVSDLDRVAVIPAEDAVPIVLGDRNFLARYQVFLDQIDLYRELRDSTGGIKSIDVTFEDRIIIQTNQGTQTSGVES